MYAVVAGTFSTQLSTIEAGKSELVDTLPKSGPVELPLTAHGLKCWQDLSNAGIKHAGDVCSALLVRYLLAGMHKPEKHEAAAPS